MSKELLTQVEALNILISAVQVAQSRGAFTLEEAGGIDKAIKVFIVQPEASNEATEEVIEPIESTDE